MAQNKFERLIDQVKSWGGDRSDISAILLVGSHARGQARVDSDVDLVIISTCPESYFLDRPWLEDFGPVLKSEVEDWGLVQSLRVWFKNGLEVEFGFTTQKWITLPLDAGTAQVLRDGFIFLVDKAGYASVIIL